MTAKMQAFVDEFLVDLNQTQAAIRCGYSAKSAPYSARMLLAKPHVRDAITAAMNERAARTKIQADVVLEAIVRNALKAEAKGDHAAATRGWELVGKHLRLFTDKVELTGKNDGPVEFSAIQRTIVDPREPQQIER